VTKIVATITLPVKLNAHENVVGPGQGHTVAKHVGKDDNFLRNRLINEPQVPAATSFLNLAQAEAVINYALTAKKADIENWLQTGGIPVLTLPFTGVSIGYGFKRPTVNPHDPAQIAKQPKEGFSNVRIVLRKGGLFGWYIVTSFPE